MKNLCHFGMGGGVWQILTSSGGSLNADRGEGGKNCQNLADVICERSLSPTAPPGYATNCSEMTETDNEPPFRVFKFLIPK